MPKIAGPVGRFFREVVDEAKKIPDVETVLPERSDGGSAGYDFRSKESYFLQPGETHMFWSDVKVHLNGNEVLMIYPRSGLGFKKGVVIKNLTGVIDSSYYGNPDNDGNIGIGLVNNGSDPVKIEVGDRIAQGVFMNYFVTDDDKFESGNAQWFGRSGGYGSSGQ